MTLEEAKTIGEVIGRADGGCAVCVDNLCIDMNAAFPEYRWTATNDRRERQSPWSDDPEDTVSDGLIVTVEAL